MNVDNSNIGIHSVFLQMLFVAQVCAYVCVKCAQVFTRVLLCLPVPGCTCAAVQVSVPSQQFGVG